MFTAIIKQSIDCSHKLALPYDSKCNRMHGHTYKITVTLQEETLNDCDMLGDYAGVKKFIKKYDHEYLNDIFPTNTQTTAERFAAILYYEIEIAGFPVISVSVKETDSTEAIYSLSSSPPTK